MIIRLILILLLVPNILVAQENDKFLNNFLQGAELRSENKLKSYSQFDFSDIWLITENANVFGIIGEEHQRIRIKFLSIKKDPVNPNHYLVSGKSNVKETICDFQGKINLSKIYEVKEFHFGVDDEYADKGIKSQGILVADYEFRENKEQNHSGVFKGKLYSKWYLNSENQIEYDNIELISDGYCNNAFVGIWESYATGKGKICNWGDYRVPISNQDFDIGDGEFNVSEKYWDKGWLDIALQNQAPNPAIKRTKGKKESKKWWE